MESGNSGNKQAAWLKWLFFGALFTTLLMFFMHFALVRFGVFSDGLGYYAPLRSAVFDKDLDVTNEYTYYARSASHFGGGIRWTDPIPRYSKYTIGMGLILSPFFIAGHFLAVLLKHMGVNLLTDGLSWPYELLYCLGSILFGIAGLLICYAGAKKQYGRWPAALAVAGVWFASPLTYYLSIESSMSHALSQFFVSLFLYLCLFSQWEHSVKRQLLTGAVLGLAALVRPQNILFSIVPFCILMFRKETEGTFPKKLRTLLIMALTAAAVIAIQILVYKIQYGTVFTSPYLGEGKDAGMDGSFDWLHPKIIPVLFSGFHGLFSWHPILLVAGAGMLLSCFSSFRRNMPLLIAFLVQVYLVASWYCWYQGTCFGGRMFCNCTFVFVMGLAFLWSHCRTRIMNAAAIAVTTFLILWNFSLMLQLESGMIPADKPVAFSTITENHIRVIPTFINHLFKR